MLTHSIWVCAAPFTCSFANLSGIGSIFLFSCYVYLVSIFSVPFAFPRIYFVGIVFFPFVGLLESLLASLFTGLCIILTMTLTFFFLVRFPIFLVALFYLFAVSFVIFAVTFNLFGNIFGAVLASVLAFSLFAFVVGHLIVLEIKNRQPIQRAIV